MNFEINKKVLKKDNIEIDPKTKELIDELNKNNNIID